mmetsp:Transcript_27768/g.86191  ORF Transcript_27768/g.86191 Transcript_27768/m.86191 type:complete len:412 (+) Transcript_27768:237-1472(+)
MIERRRLATLALLLAAALAQPPLECRGPPVVPTPAFCGDRHLRTRGKNARRRDLACRDAGMPALAGRLKIALFTYNFGNYRKEVKRYMVRNGSLAHEFGWHDKYMFTNRAPQAEHMRLDGWTVCGLPGAAYTYIPRSAFPPQYLTNPVLGAPGKRILYWELTKYFKFGHFPAVLRGYDYVYHMDLSVFTRRASGEGWGRSWEYRLHAFARVEALARANPNVELFATKHYARRNVVDEWRHTASHGRAATRPEDAVLGDANVLEDAPPLCAYEAAMRKQFGDDAVARAPLLAMGEYVRKVGAPAIDAAFADTWTALLAYALRRDQNVFPFSLWNRLGGATPQRVRWCKLDFDRRTDRSWSSCDALPGPGFRKRAPPGRGLVLRRGCRARWCAPSGVEVCPSVAGSVWANVSF